MALRYDVTVTSATVSAALVMNTYGTPFNVSLMLLNTSTGNSSSVQHTMHNPFSSDFATGATWVAHATMSSVTSTAGVDGNYAFPVSAIRLNVGTFGSGSVRLIVTQQDA